MIYAYNKDNYNIPSAFNPIPPRRILFFNIKSQN